MREVSSLLTWALSAFLLTYINRYLGRFLSLPSGEVFAGQAIASVYLSLLIFTLIQTAQAAARLKQSAPFLLVTGLALAAPFATMLFLRQQRIFPPEWLYLTANNFFLPTAAALFGAGVGRIIRHPNTLLAGAGFAIFFDIVVVTMGTVAQFLKNNPSIIAAVSVGAGSGPVVAGLKSWPVISTVTIGPADVLFLALFLSSVIMLNLSRRETVAWMFGLLTAALAIVEFFPAIPIPALAPMGAAVLIANARHAAFTKQEKRDLWIGTAFAVFCAALLVFGAQRLVPQAPPAPPRYGFTYGIDRRSGALVVTGVYERSPAARAGLKPGDVIVSVNNVATKDLTPEKFQAARGKPGGVTFRVQRAGEPSPRRIAMKPEALPNAP